jgi:hypothetical protein
MEATLSALGSIPALPQPMPNYKLCQSLGGLSLGMVQHYGLASRSAEVQKYRKPITKKREKHFFFFTQNGQRYIYLESAPPAEVSPTAGQPYWT